MLHHSAEADEGDFIRDKSLIKDDDSGVFITMKRSCIKTGPYISAEVEDNVRNFKYRGGDDGFAWHYFYNPVALRLTELLPETIAPNTVSTS